MEKLSTREERRLYLNAMYQAGSYEQYTLFKDKYPDLEPPSTTEAFHLFINAEAKTRKITPLETIDYILDHPDEFRERLERENTIRPIYKKFKTIYVHSELEDFLNNFLSAQQLKDKGITGGVKVWESRGIDYIVSVNELIKLGEKPPKVYVSQIKNVLILIKMIQEQQFNNLIKEPKCEFKLSDYAERRGYTKEEIARGGNFFNELKRDLLSGALTSYGKVVIKGKKYTVYNSFYALYQPDDPGNDWIVEFNKPYSSNILQTLTKQAFQHYQKTTKAIEDRTTTDKPHLFLFYQQLRKRAQRNLYSTPVKVRSLLEVMKLPDKILNRPKECFKLLKECIFYFNTHYEPTPEIESFFIYNDFHKTDTIRLPGNITEAFKNYSYEDYKGLLKAIGVNDIREAYISFRRPYKKPEDKKQKGLSDEETILLKRTLNWFNGKVTKIPIEVQESMIKMYIKKLGYDTYLQIFEYEANRIDADAIRFLTKDLPEILKENKTE